MTTHHSNKDQLTAIGKRLIKVVATGGTVSGGLAFLQSISQGDIPLSITWFSLFAFHLFALLTLKHNQNTAAILFICGFILPTVGLSLSRFGAGSGLYFGVACVAACAYSMITSRASLILVTLYTAAMVAILIVSKTYYPEEFAAQYILHRDRFHFNTAVTLIFSAIVVSGAVSSIKRTYDKTQKELIKEKDRVSSLNGLINESLREKSDLLDISTKMQQMGNIFGYFYYPGIDAFYQLSSSKEKPTLQTLKEAEQKAHNPDDRQAKIVALIKTALDDRQNWDMLIETVFDDGRPRFLQTKGELVFQDEEIEKIIIMVHDVTETKILTNKLTEKANHDELTGISNRRRFGEIFEELYELRLKGGPLSSYLFIDLDLFKLVNDTSGHQAGDQMLIEISKILSNNVRKGDPVGRLGGDEFGVLLKDCESKFAMQIAEKIRQQIEIFRLDWQGVSHRVEASIGVVGIDPSLGSTIEIQALADAACYHAKNNGRNRVEGVSSQEQSYKNENIASNGLSP